MTQQELKKSYDSLDDTADIVAYMQLTTATTLNNKQIAVSYL